MKTLKIIDTFPNGKMGFTLVELAIALAIMSIVFTAVFGVFSLSSRTFTTQNVAADVQQSVRGGMEIMVMDIRMAGLDPTISGNFGVEEATAAKLRFTSDSFDAGIGDFNGVVNDTNSERITYVLSGNDLNQILYEGTGSQNSQPLISNVQNLIFTYLDGDNIPLASPVAAADRANIQTVQISITVQESAGRGDPVSRTLTKRIKCRNLAFD